MKQKFFEGQKVVIKHRLHGHGFDIGTIGVIDRCTTYGYDVRAEEDVPRPGEYPFTWSLADDEMAPYSTEGYLNKDYVGLLDKY